jgi:hypothetical protein
VRPGARVRIMAVERLVGVKDCRGNSGSEWYVVVKVA